MIYAASLFIREINVSAPGRCVYDHTSVFIGRTKRTPSPRSGTRCHTSQALGEQLLREPSPHILRDKPYFRGYEKAMR